MGYLYSPSSFQFGSKLYKSLLEVQASRAVFSIIPERFRQFTAGSRALFLKFLIIGAHTGTCWFPGADLDSLKFVVRAPMPFLLPATAGAC